MKNTPLSITVITCTSPIEWSVGFQRYNDSKGEHTLSHTITKEGLHTFHLVTKVGTYFIKLTSIEKNDFAHIYISTEPEGPVALQRFPGQVLKLLKRQNRKRLTVRWKPSFVDPQGTDYCLVMSMNRHYLSLCSAQGNRYGISPAGIGNQAVTLPTETVRSWDHKESKFELLNNDPQIACVGSRMHHTLTNLQQNQAYYFNLFAINRQSNLTYLHGSASMIFDKRVKPTTLKDGKAAFVNLKKLDGKAVFRYKVSRMSLNSSLELYIMPCGGAVDIEVTLNGEIVKSKRHIVGFGRIVIPDPPIASRYYIRVLAANYEELRKTSGVEVYASTKPSIDLPLPNVPLEPNVQEYLSLKQCDSVTIGWVPSPGQKVAHYCIVVKEGRIKEMEGYKLLDQCGLENRLRKSADFFVKYCLDIKHGNEPVLVRKITQLKQGRHYIIQVTVRKPKGKALSYDLLQTQTKSRCSHPKA